MSGKKVRAALVGVTGYSGEEILRLLAYHPGVDLVYASARQDRERRVEELFPSLKNRVNLECKVFDPDEAVRNADVVFLALPHQVSMRFAPALLDKCRVIDISADYRLKNPEWYPRFYGFEHSDAARLNTAVYGLPEMNREHIRGAALLANPGCYPTGSILGLLPLLGGRFDWTGGITIDAKSGVTGAGRKASQALLFGEVSENFKAYKVSAHSHEGEILQAFENFGCRADFDFVPHLLPIRRGILTTIYAHLKGEGSYAGLRKAFNERYAAEPFVHVLPEGEYPETANVENTNQCHIGLARRASTGTVVIMTAIDNLLKGAAGQAVQNMNLMFGFDETMGL
ncbi:MAG: N-acetyl-gamma-glutamyl-phosphate reductase, partial [Candidatus Omnitrophica bacterium]|nr:N-acetyl-gamma-glutamyl-phosphate reductase [Candidatus Omnitrophota bacterium]